MSHESVPPRAEADGERIFAHDQRLRLLLAHLSGRAVRARVEPEDLVQETYLRALASSSLPERAAGEEALTRFLNRIARHVVVDAARAIRARKRDRREQPLVRSEWSRFGARASGIAAAGVGPATQAAERESRHDILAAFDSLAAEHRRVIGLRQLEGLSARAAARRMGRSETAVHSLYRRALAAWHAKMGPTQA